jgi:hypothetical protein
MKIRDLIIIASLSFMILPLVSDGQYIARYLEKDRIEKDTLIDKAKGVKFIIDKSRICIIAIKKNGKQLWKTDPVKDNKLEKYRVNRPTIVYFRFGVDNTGKKQVIRIAYNNSQAGYLDKETGHFYFQGQD